MLVNKKAETGNTMIICTLAYLLILFVTPSAALAGSKYGASLWLTELLPTLLPFFIGIRMFQQSLPQIASRRGALLLGLLCGYPTGAAFVVYQYQRGLLPKHQAYFFLGFANNPSPMFILSFCGSYILHLSYADSVFLFLTIVLTSLLGSLIFSFLYKKRYGVVCAAPSSSSLFTSGKTATFSQYIDDAIEQSFLLITKIGGYVILFCIIGQIVGQFVSLQSASGITALGALEITSGISYLKQAPLSHSTKEILTAMLLCFGGLSAAAQTNSVLAKSGLSVFPYVINKFFNAFLAGAIVSLLLRLV